MDHLRHQFDHFDLEFVHLICVWEMMTIEFFNQSINQSIDSITFIFTYGIVMRHELLQWAWLQALDILF